MKKMLINETKNEEGLERNDCLAVSIPILIKLFAT